VRGSTTGKQQLLAVLLLLRKHRGGDLHGQGGTLPCKQAKRGRPEGGCGVIPTEIFFIFIFIFSPKMTRFDIILK
jgi:hypothetical protein